VTITLDNGVDVQNFINEVKTKIDPISFPTDTKTPIVSELSTQNEKLFDLILYVTKDGFTINQLRSLAMDLKNDIKGK
jgi:multidrug efflux pump subunit AcrB